MERYIVFWGEAYYPRGGYRDQHKYLPSESAAKGFAQGVIAGDDLAWSQVVDLTIGSIIWDNVTGDYNFSKTKI